MAGLAQLAAAYRVRPSELVGLEASTLGRLIFDFAVAQAAPAAGSVAGPGG